MNPIRTHVAGSPYQPGESVLVVEAIDRYVMDLSSYIGQRGVVVYLEYECGCGQIYPHYPMIGVAFDNRPFTEFWPEELAHHD
jgi:hypothetical protein